MSTQAAAIVRSGTGRVRPRVVTYTKVCMVKTTNTGFGKSVPPKAPRAMGGKFYMSGGAGPAPRKGPSKDPRGGGQTRRQSAASSGGPFDDLKAAHSPKRCVRFAPDHGEESVRALRLDDADVKQMRVGAPKGDKVSCEEVASQRLRARGRLAKLIGKSVGVGGESSTHEIADWFRGLYGPGVRVSRAAWIPSSATRKEVAGSSEGEGETPGGYYVLVVDLGYGVEEPLHKQLGPTGPAWLEPREGKQLYIDVEMLGMLLSYASLRRRTNVLRETMRAKCLAFAREHVRASMETAYTIPCVVTAAMLFTEVEQNCFSQFKHSGLQEEMDEANLCSSGVFQTLGKRQWSKPATWLAPPLVGVTLPSA